MADLDRLAGSAQVGVPHYTEGVPIIGLSVSMCIRDIIQGRVRLEDVVEIRGATSVRSPDRWDRVIKSYQQSYWTSDPERAATICRQLLTEGKIKQPRVDGGKVHSDAEGHWLPVGQESQSAEE